MTDSSTDSDQYRRGEDRLINKQLGKIASSLHDTTRNLKSIDHMMDTIKESSSTRQSSLNEQPSSSLGDRHQARSLNSLTGGDYLPYPQMGANRTTSPSTQARHGSLPRRQESPTGVDSWMSPALSNNLLLQRSGSVRFVSPSGQGGLDGRMLTMQQPLVGSAEELHELHKNVRDLASEQSLIRGQVERLGRTRGGESINSGPFKDLVDHVRKTSNPTAPVGGPQSQPGNPSISIVASVERRLTEAKEALKAERRGVDRRQPALGQVSSALRTALDQMHQRDISDTAAATSAASAAREAEERLMRSQLIQAETAWSGLQQEVETLRRRLGQEEGTRTALQRQLEELQTRMTALDRERSGLRAQVDDYEAKLERGRRRQESEEADRRDRMRLEAELTQLRTQLAHMVSSEELEKVRRHASQLERQRDQLTEQTDSQSRELESKERQLTRLLEEVREAQGRAELSERARQELTNQVTDIEREVRELQRREQISIDRADRAERLAVEAEAAREVGAREAVDVAQDWEERAGRYQKEAKRLGQLVSEQTARAESATLEADSLRGQLIGLQTQTDSLRQELEQLLNARAKQDEQMRRWDQENESLRLRQYELEARLETEEKLGLKYKFDAETMEHELNVVREERARLEEKLAGSDAARTTATDQLTQLQAELRELARERAHLAHTASEAVLQAQEEKSHRVQVVELARQLDELKRSKQEAVTSAERRARAAGAEISAELVTQREQLEAERAAARALMTRCDRQAGELARLHDEHWRSEQELARVRRKLGKARQRIEEAQTVADMQQANSASGAAHGVSGTDLEEEAGHLREQLVSTVRERDQVLGWVTTDVDALVEVTAAGSLMINAELAASGGAGPAALPTLCSSSSAAADLNYLRQAVLLLPGGLDMSDVSGGVGPSAAAAIPTIVPRPTLNPGRWLVDLKAKMSWLRTEVKRLMQRYQLTIRQLRRDGHSYSWMEEPRRSSEDLSGHSAALGGVSAGAYHTEPDKAARVRNGLDQLLEARTGLDALRVKEEEAELETRRIQEQYDRLQLTLERIRRDLRSLDPTDYHEHSGGQHHLHGPATTHRRPVTPSPCPAPRHRRFPPRPTTACACVTASADFSSCH